MVIRPLDLVKNNSDHVFMAIERSRANELFIAYSVIDTIKLSREHWRERALDAEFKLELIKNVGTYIILPAIGAAIWEYLR